ncbi:hypothetical protein N7535_004024 [Penicillium sp. DV-2018c]|nr:hypothetical protein N7535_004024 [Penicillium sp. DV-2018c]
MRLRSERVIDPNSWQPRPRRTRSASVQENTVSGSASEAQPAPENQSATQSNPAPRRKPARKAAPKKGGAKGKKNASEPDTQTESQNGTQPDPINVLPSIEENEPRRSPPPIPKRAPIQKRVIRNRRTGRPSRAFPFSAVDVIKDEMRRRARTPSPTPSPPKTPEMPYAWPPLPDGQSYDKRTHIPWSLPWTPPSLEQFPPQISSTTEEPTSRKRNRVSEDDDPSAKRHKLVLHTPARMGSRPRGSPRRTYADRARRREAERNGRIDRTIYRTPQLLAQQGEETRSVYSTPSDQRPNAAPATHHNNVDSATTLPSALPPTQGQAGWIVGPQPAVGSDPSTTTPSSAVSVGFFTPRSNNNQSSPFSARLTASARGPRSTQRKKYTYDLDPCGFDPALLARMRAGSSKPKQKPVPAQPEKVQALGDNGPKKRKRQPSPDVIPNPPGCSYGFDPDYFIYDDEDDDDEEDGEDDIMVGDQTGQATRKTQATVSDASEDESEQHVSKRVRFSRPLPRNTDRVFPENFNHQGHFEVPYSSSASTSSDASPQSTSKKDSPSESVPPEPQVPSGLRDVSHEPMSSDSQVHIQARDYAKRHIERYMPKTPSRLRTALHASPQDQEAHKKAQDTLRRRRIGPNRRLSRTITSQVCPNLSYDIVKWPEPQDWVSRLGFDKDLLIYVGMDRSSGKMREEIEEIHKNFMRLLAERRALRRRRRNISKSRRTSASPPRAI